MAARFDIEAVRMVSRSLEPSGRQSLREYMDKGLDKGLDKG